MVSMLREEVTETEYESRKRGIGMKQRQMECVRGVKGRGVTEKV